MLCNQCLVLWEDKDRTNRLIIRSNNDGISRQVLRYIVRNTKLPQRTRAQAQLQLSQMHAYTRPTQLKNRCVAGGTARSVFRDFRIARVSLGIGLVYFAMLCYATLFYAVLCYGMLC